MTLPHLELEPSEDGYSATDGEVVLQARVSAGPSVMRLDMLGAPFDVSVSYQMTREQYAYWRAFYRDTIIYGSLPFTAMLVTDGPDLVAHEVRIVPGSVRLAAVRGQLYSVSMRLEAVPVDADPSYDETLVMLYELYGDDADEILAGLAQLALVDLVIE